MPPHAREAALDFAAAYDATIERNEDRRLGNAASPSQDLGVAWRDLYAQIASGSVLAAESPTLTAYALGDFKPRLVLERLLDPRPSYYAHKDILFAGLCAWTVAPKHKILIEDAIVLAGATKLAAVEQKHQEQLPQAPMLADLVARVAGPGIDFYQDFYYPAGGLQRIIKARSPRLMRRSLQVASREIGYAVEMMRVCHDHAVRLKDRTQYRAASYVAGGQAISALVALNKTQSGIINSFIGDKKSNRTIDGPNCKKKSDIYSSSAAMLYAAYSIDLYDCNLLRLICDGKAKYYKHGRLLDEWVGRASYIAKNVIAPMYTRQGMADQIDYLREFEPKSFDPPKYNTAASIIDDAFKIAKPAKSR